DQWDFLAIELMGNAVNGDSQHARIAEDDFIPTAGGRVSIIGRLNICQENPADFGESAKKLNRCLLSFRFKIPLAGLRRSREAVLLVVLVPQRPADLLSQLPMQAVNQVPDVVRDIPEVEILAA